MKYNGYQEVQKGAFRVKCAATLGFTSFES